MMRKKAVSYWCLPDETEAAPIEAVIAALAAAQGAPVFAPHLTLATLTQPATDLGDVLRALRGLTLAPIGLDGTAVFTTSLFIRFAASEALLQARAMMTALPGFRESRPFDPHLSLCYGPPPDLAPHHSAIDALLTHPLRFNRLAAMEVSLPVETHEDVAGWRIAEVWAL
ncbi:2'-5' RNA ligase family protein [Hyphomonas sp.]|uniref:2'-5' RNA ligase family protein n=1 Tax=Hyphomonas sp. TaxID=87 RepID=UPI00391AD8D3